MGADHAAIPRLDESGTVQPMGIDRSKAIWEHLKATGYIDARGRVQDKLRTALKEGTLSVPAEFEAQHGSIAEVLRKLAGRLEVKNADERRQVRTRQAVLHSEEFNALWDRIKHKTTYRVQFDNEKLIESCIRAIKDGPAIAKTRLQWRKADLAIGKAGVEAKEREGAATVVLDEADIELPDLLTDLQDRTQLTRRTIYRVLVGSGRLDDFKRNPQQFIEMTAEAINRCKRLVVVDGIKYQRLGDEHYYAQELFEQEELTGYLKNMLADTKKSVYEHVGARPEGLERLAPGDGIVGCLEPPGFDQRRLDGGRSRLERGPCVDAGDAVRDHPLGALEAQDGIQRGLAEHAIERKRSPLVIEERLQLAHGLASRALLERRPGLRRGRVRDNRSFMRGRQGNSPWRLGVVERLDRLHRHVRVVIVRVLSAVGTPLPGRVILAGAGEDAPVRDDVLNAIVAARPQRLGKSVGVEASGRIMCISRYSI
jgi:hypothetical protein